MFTGIVQSVGKILAREDKPEGARLRIDVGMLSMEDTNLGDSISVNGVCLTVVDFSLSHFCTDLSSETLARTTLGRLNLGSSVNLEPALLATSRLGGHLVSGHVDGVGTIKSKTIFGDAIKFFIEIPYTLSRFVAEKGSVTVEGISLTVNGVRNDLFDLMLIPHTMDKTTAHSWQVGTVVNIEIDILARYVERLLHCNVSSVPHTTTLTEEFLEKHGFSGG